MYLTHGKRDVSRGDVQGVVFSPRPAPQGFTKIQALRDLLGEHRRKIFFLMLVIMKKRGE